MSIAAWRVVLWVLGVIALYLVVTTGAASFAKPGIFNWEFLAFVLSTMAFTSAVRLDERLSLKEKRNG